MLLGNSALTRVPVDDLIDLLRHVHRGELTGPLQAPDIARVGLQHRQEDLMGTLRGLDTRSVKAVLIAVIAERWEKDGR